MAGAGETITLQVPGRGEFNVVNTSTDDYRLNQITGRWMSAGQACCYLGCANPLGFGAVAETWAVKVIRRVWVAQVCWGDGSFETVADCQDTREDAIVAVRNWFRLNEMEAEPFQVFSREVGNASGDD